MSSIENIILANIMHDHDYATRILPFIKPEYFDDPAHRCLVDLMATFVDKYKEPPTKEALEVLVDRLSNVNEKQFAVIQETLDVISVDPKTNKDWILKETETFCKTRDLYSSIRTSMEILDGTNNKFELDAIPKMMQDSLNIAFNTSVGHDFTRDAETRYDSYHETFERIPSDIEILNKVLDGGFPRKTLSLFLGTTGAGKSIVLGHLGISAWMAGRNVLYISLELSEKELGKRMDANALGVDLKEVKELSKTAYLKKIESLKSKIPSRFIFQEFPTSSAHVGHFRFLLKELESKQGFVPDLILVDYVNICASSRIKSSAGANSYTIVKSITEELRGLAVEANVAMVSASQLNRCLALDTEVESQTRGRIQIKDVQAGEQLLSHDGYREVKHVFPVTKQKAFKVTLKSGKTIICSDRHVFPTNRGEISMEHGLGVGDRLKSK